MRFNDKLNSTSQRKIVFYSFLLTAVLILMIYLFSARPLVDKLEFVKLNMITLQNELDGLLERQDDQSGEIPTSYKLAQALGYIQDYLEVNAVVVEEINIAQLSAQASDGFYQALIKIRVNGNSPQILRIIGEIILESRYPLILQEVDIGRNTEINLKLLYRKSTDT